MGHNFWNLRQLERRDGRKKSKNNPQAGVCLGKGSAGDQMCVGAGRRCCGLAQTQSGQELDRSSLDGSMQPWEDPARQGGSGNIPGFGIRGCREFSSACASAGACLLTQQAEGLALQQRCSPACFLPCGWNLVDRNPQVGKGKERLGQRECAKLGTNPEPRPQPGYKLPPCRAILALAVFSLVINLLGTGGVSPWMPRAVP